MEQIWCGAATYYILITIDVIRVRAEKKATHWAPTGKFIINDAKWGRYKLRGKKSVCVREGVLWCQWNERYVLGSVKRAVNRALFLKKNPQKSKQLLHEIGTRTRNKNI